MIQDSSKVRNRIQQCDLVVTENCSLRCKMCYIWKHAKDDEQLCLKDYMDFMYSLKEFVGDKIQVQFVGGEPLLKKGIVELINCAARQGFSTTMTTNGFMLDKEMVDRIIDSGLDTLGFSLESMEEDKHDFLRGVHGVHNRIIDTLNCFYKFTEPKLQIFIASIITGINLKDLIELAEWVENNMHISFIYFLAVMQPFAMPDNENWYNGEQLKFLWPDADEAEDTLRELIRLKKSGYKINNHIAQLEMFKSYFRTPQRFIKRTNCNLGYKSFTVLPDGNIFLCLSMQPIGNIKTDKIDQVWYSEKADKVRAQIADCKHNCKLMINCFFEEETVEDVINDV